MNRDLIDIRRIASYIIIAFIFCLFSPWWIIAIIGTFIGFYAKTIYTAIFESIISLSIVWFIMIINNLFIQDYLIIHKIKDFLGLNDIALIMITLSIPILIGFISSLFGYELKKGVSFEE